MIDGLLGIVALFAVLTVMYLIPGIAITVGVIVGIGYVLFAGGGAILGVIPWWVWVIVVILLVCGAGKK